MPNHHGVDLDRAGAVNDNRPDLAQRAHQKDGKKSKDGRVSGKAEGLSRSPSHYPQASGLPGELMIIQDASRGRSKTLGIPGILNTTTLGPDQRNRLVDGIIDMSSKGRTADGPVHSVSGRDATAMNAGMRALPGAPIH